MLPPQLLDELDELTHRLGADLIMGPRAHHAYGKWLTVHLDDESMETLGQKVSVTWVGDDKVRVEAGFAIKVEVAALAGSGKRSEAAAFVEALLTGGVREGVVRDVAGGWSRLVWEGSSPSFRWTEASPTPDEHVLWRRTLGMPRSGRTPMDATA
ncbi:hypothetical protein ATL41_1768 [Flavimobilis soli]|jgi:hypothetical protein|uniref:Uncharacterized protein n=1 Tax=Flavimobilis soli TaxID=442709 RepID=A0A2A9EDN3_9MICO|nr:hypothetical protein [Flavimobilis soli]PFG37024.1 hypothetical protein ATL41_1768 [Flavimobilis soli]